jgi:hypothetical protein
MSIQSAERFAGGRWLGRSVEWEAVEESLSSDGGLLVFAQLDEQLGWTRSFSDLITDRRDDPEHSVLSMVRQRVFGIIAGYEDQNDHDTLRSDVIFKLIAGRTPQEGELASQPTLSRLENMVTVRDLFRMREWFIDRFLESFESEPALVTLDVDTLDDPAHGKQQLALFHDYYKQNQYQVRVTTCAENDQVALPTLLGGTAAAKAGAADEWTEIITRLQSRFPGVAVHLRGDSGFAGAEEYRVLDALPNVIYTLGFPMNPKLKTLAQTQLEEAQAAQKATGQAQQLYLVLEEYDTKYWDRPHTVIVKTEVTAHSSSQRAIVTNHSDAVRDPAGVYHSYAQRGESENRNKELKCDLCIDRLSDHRFLANLFRVNMHCLAHNLVVAMRREVARHAPSAPAPQANDDPPPAPVESEYARRKRHNDRRRRDCLSQAQPNTWRMLVIKVAARVVVSVRRVCIELSSTWPHLRHLRRAALALEVGSSK